MGTDTERKQNGGHPMHHFEECIANNFERKESKLKFQLAPVLIQHLTRRARCASFCVSMHFFASPRSAGSVAGIWSSRPFCFWCHLCKHEHTDVLSVCSEFTPALWMEGGLHFPTRSSPWGVNLFYVALRSTEWRQGSAYLQEWAHYGGVPKPNYGRLEMLLW